MYKHFFKRLIDFTIALIAILCLSPILAIVTIWLHFANKGAGAFFTQERPGKDAKIFRVIKFKTMTDERDTNGNLLPDAQRLTKVGRIVRSTSLDELPQLFNVLKGDMALIGPRPLLVKYLPLYTPTQMRRHEVRPGITGWAQVNGRNTITHTKKFEYDVWYVDHLSFALDLKIIFMTIYNVLHRKDISTEGQATAPTFDGTNYVDTGVAPLATDAPFTVLVDWTNTGESAFAGSKHVIMHCMTENNPYPGMILQYNTNGIVSEYRQGSNTISSNSTSALIENADLSRVKVVYRKAEDGTVTVSRCYNENGQIHKNTKYMDYVAVPEELRLGCYRSNVNGTGRFAKGILNDCRIYDVALTDEQLEEFLLN